MMYQLPPQAVKYLSESLDRRTTQSPKSELGGYLSEYYGGGWGAPGTGNLTNVKPQMPQYVKGESPEEIAAEKTKKKKEMQKWGSGGFGVGGPTGKKGDKGPGNILFGDTEEEDIGLGGAAAAYGAGKAFGTIADVIDATGAQQAGNFIASNLPKGSGLLGSLGSAVASKAIMSIPGLGSKLFRQLENLSGSSWFDANVSKISQNQMGLAAQGAGKPFVPLVIPGEVKNKVAQYDPNAQRKAAIEAAREDEEIKKLRSKGYVIP